MLYHFGERIHHDERRQRSVRRISQLHSVHFHLCPKEAPLPPRTLEMTYEGMNTHSWGRREVYCDLRTLDHRSLTKRWKPFLKEWLSPRRLSIWVRLIFSLVAYRCNMMTGYTIYTFRFDWQRQVVRPLSSVVQNSSRASTCLIVFTPSVRRLKPTTHSKIAEYWPLFVFPAPFLQFVSGQLARSRFNPQNSPAHSDSVPS